MLRHPSNGSISRLPWLALLWFAAASCSAAGTTAPRADETRGDVRIVVISDLNSSYGSTEYEPEVHRAVELIRGTWRPDLVLAAGDLIAGQRPSLSDDNVRAMWSAFDAVVGRPLREAGIPFGFTLGNHDGSAYPAHARDRRLALEHWRDPRHRPGVAFVDSTHFPVFFSFEQDGVFVVSWDASNEDALKRREMMEWLEAQLAGPRAAAARYRLVLGHLPLYAVAEGRNRTGEVLAGADSLRAILERHDVHTYVSGHHHAFFPGRRGALELLHAGALGQGARPLIGSDRPPVQTVTVLDFHFASDSVAYRTYAFERNAGGGTGMRRMENAELPRRLEGFNGWVARRDLPDAGHR